MNFVDLQSVAVHDEWAGNKYGSSMMIIFN